jgi:hypothetical protein
MVDPAAGWADHEHFVDVIGHLGPTLGNFTEHQVVRDSGAVGLDHAFVGTSVSADTGDGFRIVVDYSSEFVGSLRAPRVLGTWQAFLL